MSRLFSHDQYELNNNRTVYFWENPRQCTNDLYVRTILGPYCRQRIPTTANAKFSTRQTANTNESMHVFINRRGLHNFYMWCNKINSDVMKTGDAVVVETLSSFVDDTKLFVYAVSVPSSVVAPIPTSKCSDR